MNKYISKLINMSKILIETEKPSNLKPDFWYEEYLEIDNNYLLKHPEEQIPLTIIKEIKEFDVMADKNQTHTHTVVFYNLKKRTI